MRLYRKRKAPPLVAIAFATAVLVLGDKMLAAGPADFVPTFENCETDCNVATTAAVIFTGERERLKAGLQLYLDGRVGHVFISGQPGNMQVATLIRRLGLDRHKAKQDDLSRIVIERTAENTEGNARSTAEWIAAMNARETPIRTVVLVTSDYHMPRSVEALGESAGKVELYQMPVSVRAGVATHFSEYLKRSLRPFVRTEKQIPGI